MSYPPPPHNIAYSYHTLTANVLHNTSSVLPYCSVYLTPPIMWYPPQGDKIAKYALVGAACQLGGTVRMTISLAVIVLECTGDITFSVPIILSLFISKWIADFFNPVSHSRIGRFGGRIW